MGSVNTKSVFTPVSFGCLLLTGGALLAAGVTAATAAVPDNAEAEGPAAQPEGEVQEVLVTAQRRSERATDVPLSVTALSASALETSGVTDTTSLTNITPGLRMDRLGVYTQPAIRGVTAASTSPGAEANVAMYVD